MHQGLPSWVKLALGSFELWFGSSIASVRLVWASCSSFLDSGTNSFVLSMRVVASIWMQRCSLLQQDTNYISYLHYKVVAQVLLWNILIKFSWAIVYRVVIDLNSWSKLGLSYLSFAIFHIETEFIYYRYLGNVSSAEIFMQETKLNKKSYCNNFRHFYWANKTWKIE